MNPTTFIWDPRVFGKSCLIPKHDMVDVHNSFQDYNTPYFNDPSHRDIAGNEYVDKLAKQATPIRVSDEDKVFFGIRDP